MFFPLLKDPFILIFLFLIVGAGITALSFLFTESIKNILERFKFSENFIGSSLLAIGTSLSETITSITAGVYDRWWSNSQEGVKEEMQFSINSLYNLTGANLVQIIFLSLTTLYIWHKFKRKKKLRREYKKFISSVFQGKLLLWSISTIELTFLWGFFIFKDFAKSINIGGYNLIPFFFLIVWVLYMLFTKKTNSSNILPTNSNYQELKYKNIFQNLSNFNFFIVFVFIFLAFSLLAFINFTIVSNFESVLKIHKNIGLGTILSLMTSLPEFCSFFFLFRAKCYDTACSGFLGSALFNLMLPSFTQLIKGNWLFDNLDNSERLSLIFWIFTILLINVCFALGFYTNKKGTFLRDIKNFSWNINWIYLIIFLYIVCTLIISSLLTF